MKLRKLASILLAAVMLLTLCACGSASTSGTQTVTSGSTAGTISADVPEETPAADIPEETPAETPTADEPEDVPEEAPAVDEPEAAPEEAASAGAAVNSTYENRYFGIGVTLDDNWTFSTPEEIAAANGLAEDVVADEAFTAAMESSGVYMDMMAVAEGGIFNMNATIEKLNAVYSLSLDEDSYIDLAMEANDFEAVFAQMGIDVTLLEKSSVRIAGAEHPCISIVGNVEGVDIYEKVAVIKVGSYVLSLTVTSLTVDITDSLFESFYAL